MSIREKTLIVIASIAIIIGLACAIGLAAITFWNDWWIQGGLFFGFDVTHSWTVGTLRFGSNAPTPGESTARCMGGLKLPLGATTGRG